MLALASLVSLTLLQHQAGPHMLRHSSLPRLNLRLAAEETVEEVDWQARQQAAVAAYEQERRRGVLIAAASGAVAASFYAFQRANPADPVRLLQLMESESLSLPEALANGRPTVVEFYAPWCESCKELAPSMLKLERSLGKEANFVVVNGDAPQNAQLVRTFGVDGIPHVALISAKRKLAATLVGGIPESVLEADIMALLKERPLPYGASASTSTAEQSAGRAGTTDLNG